MNTSNCALFALGIAPLLLSAACAGAVGEEGSSADDPGEILARTNRFDKDPISLIEEKVDGASEV